METPTEYCRLGYYMLLV